MIPYYKLFQFAGVILLNLLCHVMTSVLQGISLTAATNNLISLDLSNLAFLLLPPIIVYSIRYFDDQWLSNDFRPIILFKSIQLFSYLVAANLIWWTVFFYSPMEGGSILLWAGKSILISSTIFGIGCAVINLASQQIRRSIDEPKRILIVGNNAAGIEICNALTAKRYVKWLGLYDVENIGHPDEKLDTDKLEEFIHGDQDLLKLQQERGIRQIIICLPAKRSDTFVSAIYECRKRGVTVDEFSPFYEKLTHKVPILHIEKNSISFDGELKIDTTHAILSRIYNMALSTMGLICFYLIIYPVIYVLQRFFIPGKSHFLQRRVGLFDTPFVIVKLKTMLEHIAAPGKENLEWAIEGDPRVNRLGKLLRTTKLDEFPQLWNVLKGDMNIVGPRPQMLDLVRNFENKIPYYSRRHLIRPGITGWAQVNHHALQSQEDVLNGLQYDLYYVKHRSFTFDLYILYRTFTRVLLGLPKNKR